MPSGDVLRRAAETGATPYDIPGVELSSEIDGLQAHILGYFIDPSSASLQHEFAWMNATRQARIQQICVNLNAAGIPIDPEEVILTGAMAIWAYLVAFHQLHGRTRRILYRDGRGAEVLVAAHG